jgi:class 3 adenylate cyclase
VAALLNEHFALLAACVEAEGGTVDKYLGDGMMAFWGAPERVKGRAARACRAALAMREAIAGDNARRRAEGRSPVRVRIGIHRGPLVVGNIGAPGRINYTVVGDTVNVAQRLQDLGRKVADGGECVIIVSDAVVEDAGNGLAFAEFGALPVRGRQEPVAAFELRGAAPSTPAAPA